MDSDAATRVDGNPNRLRTGDIELRAGDNRPGYNAGVRDEAGTISGKFWYDRDEDGFQQDGEGEVIASEDVMGEPVTVELLKDGEVVASQEVTDGTYSFSGLEPGNYQVRVVDLPEGWRITDNPRGHDGNLVEAEIEDNTTGSSDVIGLDWGVTTERDVPVVDTASLSGVVYRENDRNGRVEEDAPTVAGAIIYLLDEEGNFVVRNGQLAAAVTDTNGAYRFDGLTPGTYGVQIQPPRGYVLSDQAGGLDNLDAEYLSDVDPTDGRLTGIELSGSENQVNVDAVVNNRLSISGTVVNDANADGLLDEGEGRYANIRVVLTDQNGEPIEGIDAVQTDELGNYAFTDIPARAGGYQVQFISPEGTVFSPVQTRGDITEEGRNDANADGFTRIIRAVAGEDKPNVDAFINNQGSITGHFYLERDRDGIVDATNERIDEVRVSTIVGGEEVFATVNEDGTFAFTGLPAGDYDLTFHIPAGYRISAHAGEEQELTDGLRNDVPEDGIIRGVTVTAGETVDNVDLVVHRIGGVSGTVYVESDRDGRVEPDAPTLPAVLVELLDEDDNVIDSTRTDDNGNYEFTNVVAGDGYRVRITVPEGYHLSAQAGDANDITAELLNDVAPNTRTTAAFEVTTGAIVDNVDAVLHQLGGISGRIIAESERDGRITDGETTTGVANVEVRLLDAEGNAVTDETGNAIITRTDENGNYSFGGQLAGDYQVEFDLPSGFRLSPTTGGDDVTESGLNDFRGEDGETTVRATVTVGAGQTAENVDAIVYGVGGISGTLWQDDNADGTIDGDESVRFGGVTVQLVDANGDVVAETTTNSEGEYSFSGIPQGLYTLRVSNPEGKFEQTSDPVSGTENPSREVTVTIESGQTQDGQNFGFREVEEEPSETEDPLVPPTDPSEPSEEPTEPTSTEESTEPSETEEPTEPTSTEESSEPEEPTDPSTTEEETSEPSETEEPSEPTEPTEPTEPSETEEPTTEPEVEDAKISGTIWRDDNRDGTIDDGEQRLSGVVVALVDDNGSEVQRVTTGTDGGYLFEDVEPGQYRVVVVDGPEDLVLVSDYDPSDGLSNEQLIEVEAGDEFDGLDFGYAEPEPVVIPPAGLSGVIFHDTNRDGDKTMEPGIAGVTVTVYNEDGEVVATLTTDEFGQYSVGDLEPGTYRVVVEFPDGFDGQSADPDGPVSTQALEYEITLESDEVAEGIDFGFVTDEPEEPIVPPTTDPTEPTEPSEPSETTEPSESTEPSVPVEPTEPSETDEPTQPSESTEPTETSGVVPGDEPEASESDTPVSPAPVAPGEAGGSPQQGGGATDAPAAGSDAQDSSSGGILAETGANVLWLVLAALLSIAAGLLLVMKRRKDA
ncbi:MAG: SdrD B-like domain-containing protein [Corynebacterium camporealensis]|uniref:SdrD B-like domain-containing protein n=1 Tax=Corynebacterium camporealensis TaxID=161896 RepID=UPI002A90CFD3|nr:SdrD B-like domain-containing protein [Corynebacterium camporealensis]MDY5839847.1 SdrD B-like domain-containing protein [Corynebacterium camporealensis]